MSWDLMLFHLDALADDAWIQSPLPLGSPLAVKKQISEAWPTTLWSAARGRAEIAGCLFEISLATEDADNVTVVHLAVQRDGDPLPALRSLCSRNDWFAFDSESGEVVDLEPK